MEQYETYKDSGIDWIGEIPFEWRVPKVAYLTSKVGSGKTPSGGSDVYVDEGIMFLRSQNIYDESLAIDSVSYISPDIDEEMKNTRVQYGDVLINITGGSIGRCCIFDLSNTPANVNQHVCIIRVNPNSVLNSFMRYFWISGAGKALVCYMQTGGNREGLNFEQIKSTRIPLPSFIEQGAIVHYLNRKIAQIDHLITDKENFITLLREKRQTIISEAVTKGLDHTVPMKDSGIEWIGEIPKGWKAVKIKYLATEQNTLFIDGDWIESDVIESEGIRYLTTGNVGAGFFKEQGNGFISSDSFFKLNCTKVLPGDLIMSRLNEPVGRACLVPDTYNEYVVAVDNVILRPNKGVFKKYLLYFMNLPSYSHEALLTARGTTMSRISRTQLSNLSVLMPPFREQQRIVDFLDIEISKLDVLISDIQIQIEKLREYRQAIISEAVTGKVEITEEGAS